MREVAWRDLLGRPRGEMDCLDLVCEFYRRGGIELGSREALIAAAVAGTPSRFVEVHDAPAYGDVVCMWDDHPGATEHVGVVVERRQVLHSSAATRSVSVVKLEALVKLRRVSRRLRYVAA